MTVAVRDGRVGTRLSSAVVGGAFVVGFVLAAWLVVADIRLKSSLDRQDAGSIEDAAGWLPE